jgi:hypothetical protein
MFSVSRIIEAVTRNRIDWLRARSARLSVIGYQVSGKGISQ